MVYQLFTPISPAAVKKQEHILANVLPVATAFCLLPLKKQIECCQEAT